MKIITTKLIVAFLTGSFTTSCLAGDDKATTLLSLIDTYPTVTVSHNPTDKNLVAVYCERDPQWWGRLTVFHRDGDQLDWSFNFPKNYEEFRGHYVLRFRWINLKQIESPALELIESTHMGNGSLRLFQLVDRDLILILDATVRGNCWSLPAEFGIPLNGEARFEGEHLNIEYVRNEEQTSDSVVLTGSISIQDITGKELPSRKLMQTCTWSSEEKLFKCGIPTSH